MVLGCNPCQSRLHVWLLPDDQLAGEHAGEAGACRALPPGGSQKRRDPPRTRCDRHDFRPSRQPDNSARGARARHRPFGGRDRAASQRTAVSPRKRDWPWHCLRGSRDQHPTHCERAVAERRDADRLLHDHHSCRHGQYPVGRYSQAMTRGAYKTEQKPRPTLKGRCGQRPE